MTDGLDQTQRAALFDEQGHLRRDAFDEGGWAVLTACTRWLEEIGRPMYLPIDLLLVLVERGHDDLAAAIARASRGDEASDAVADGLRGLARRVERHHDEPPALHISQLSLGFLGMVTDAWSWAREAERDQVAEEDLARVSRWRAELQESASVRWAIRQLGQPGGAHLFDATGALRTDAFEPSTWALVQKAMRLSAGAGMPFLGTPHFIAAFCTQRGGLLVRAAESAGVDPRRMQDELMRIVGSRSPAQAEFELSRRTLTPRLVRMIVAASERGEARGHRVSEADLLAAFVDDGGSSLDLVRAMGIVPHLRDLLGDNRVRTRHVDAEAMALDPMEPASSATPTLDLLGRDLTAEARDGRLAPVLGREEELRRVINILLRTEQRNPLLTGEAGVGKTALAVALAHRIAEGRVPARLRDVRVVEINGASLVGGTSYRGELEARIKALLSEAGDDVVLFIDEAHAVFAPRSSSGQPAEVPNHFKAALASGQIAVVAATTEAEYHRWIEQDPALRRRFERIEVAELSSEMTRRILVDLSPRYERDYEVPVTPDAVDAAIELSERFLPEQSLPDKAKKLLMDATIAVASELALQGDTRPADDDSTPVRDDGTPNKRVVTRMDVAAQISARTGVPLDRVAGGNVGWWAGLGERLRDRVIGQHRAIEQIAQALVAGRLNVAGRRRPQAVFVFAGPPGVGMVEVAEALADEVFGSRRALLRLEMADFAEAHSLSRLIGSPPGYVGYQDEDALVSPLRRRPGSVVLLKDFDLAHPRVQERFVRLFEEGEIADTRGLRADARHAIFVLIVTCDASTRAGIGFASSAASAPVTLREVDETLHDRLKGYAYEFVLFRGLDDTDAGALAIELIEARLEHFREVLRLEYELELDLAPAMIDAMRDEARGVRDARELEALFRRHVVDPVSRRLLSGVHGPRLAVETREVEPVS